MPLIQGRERRGLKAPWRFSSIFLITASRTEMARLTAPSASAPGDRGGRVGLGSIWGAGTASLAGSRATGAAAGLEGEPSGVGGGLSPLSPGGTEIVMVPRSRM